MPTAVKPAWLVLGYGPPWFIAARTATRELAERVGAEVEALWINGPAGGGGVRRYAQERIGVVSLLLDRSRARPKVTLLEEDRETQAA